MLEAQAQALVNAGQISASEMAEYKALLNQPLNGTHSTPALPKLLSTQYVKSYLGCSKQTLNRWCNEGRLERVKCSRKKIFITAQSLQNFIGLAA